MSSLKAQKTFKNFERVFEFQLPEELKSFFRRSRTVRYLNTLTPQQICKLDMYSPAIPLRVLPVFTLTSGDILGLYFPRLGGRPIVVCFDHECSSIYTITTNLRAFFKSPDLYSPDHPKVLSRKKRYVRCKVKREKLIIDVHATNPENEMLKPLSLHFRKLDAEPRNYFVPLLRRIQRAPSTSHLVRKLFSSPIDMLASANWIQFAKDLISQKRWADAIQALDNCHVIHSIYPYYGYPPRHVTPRWRPIAAVLRRLYPLVLSHGDGLDRLLVQRSLRLALQWSRTEA